MVKLAALLCVLALILQPCLASSGDRLPAYRSCVEKCSSLTEVSSLPIHLRLTWWTPRQDCQYRCMQGITEYALATGGMIHQFHGKWPFKRLFGMQEPASVLFSILNGLIHWRYYNILNHEIKSTYNLKRHYLLSPIIAINAWIWSTIFHYRDFSFTEKMDYFSAGLYILYGLYLGVLRIFYLRQAANIWACLCLTFYVGHVTYLWNCERFDYSYNMTACITIGIIQNSLWLFWTVQQYTRWGNPERRSYAWMVGLSVILVSGSMSLEVFDFPPWNSVLDAHSLWHAATIPIIPLFYRFLIHDANMEATNSTRSKLAAKKRTL